MRGEPSATCKVAAHLGSFLRNTDAQHKPEDEKCPVSRYMRAHPFNISVQVILPHPLDQAVQIEVDAEHSLGPMPDLKFYAARMSLVDILGLSSHWSSYSDLAAFTARTPLDRTDALAITPDGKLHMALTKESYQQLGVQGVASKGCATPKGERYNVCVPLKSKPSLKRTNRIEKLSRLWGEITNTMDFLCVGSMHSNDESHASPFPAGMEGTPLRTHQVTRTQHTISMDSLPPLATTSLLSTSSVDPDHATEHRMQFLDAVHEWIGVVVCASGTLDVKDGTCIHLHNSHVTNDIHNNQDDQPAALHEESQKAPARPSVVVESQYEWPLDGGVCSWEVDVHTWRGLISALRVQDCLAKCRMWVSQGSIPWAVINVSGPVDTPVAWTGDPSLNSRPATEHSYFMGGENGYAIVILPADRYIVYVVSM